MSLSALLLYVYLLGRRDGVARAERLLARRLDSK